MSRFARDTLLWSIFFGILVLIISGCATTEVRYNNYVRCEPTGEVRTLEEATGTFDKWCPGLGTTETFTVKDTVKESFWDGFIPEGDSGPTTTYVPVPEYTPPPVQPITTEYGPWPVIECNWDTGECSTTYTHSP